jgi:hypothetical protein
MKRIIALLLALTVSPVPMPGEDTPPVTVPSDGKNSKCPHSSGHS